MRVKGIEFFLSTNPSEKEYLKGLFVLYFVEDAGYDECNFVVSISKLMAKVCFAEHVGMDHDEPMRVRKVLDIPTDEPLWDEWETKLEGAALGYIWKGQFMVPDETLVLWGLSIGIHVPLPRSYLSAGLTIPAD